MSEAEDKKVKKGKIKIINYKEREFFLRVTGYSKGSSFEKVPIAIDEIDKGAIEKYSLCKGARLKCSCGDNTSNYNVLPVNKVSINGNPVGVISDTKPMINILPFGLCFSMANPTVAAATAANQGKLQKMPCVPNIVDSWSEGISHFLLNEETPCNLSKVKCLYSGIISVMNAGQSIVGSSSGGSGSSDSEENSDSDNNSQDKVVEGVLYLKSKHFSGLEE